MIGPEHQVGNAPGEPFQSIDHDGDDDMRRFSLLMLFGVIAAGCAQKSIGPTSFSPQYQSQLDASDVVVVRSCATLSDVKVSNGMKGATVGQRTLESSSVPPQTIRIGGDVKTWLGASTKEMFQRAAIKTGVAGAPSLTVTLSEMRINENVHVNAGYDARLIIDAALQSPGGKECWAGRKTGFAQNYGHAGSTEAYRETIDHALDRAVMSIAADPEFQAAVCGTCRH